MAAARALASSGNPWLQRLPDQNEEVGRGRAPQPPSPRPIVWFAAREWPKCGDWRLVTPKRRPERATETATRTSRTRRGVVENRGVGVFVRFWGGFGRRRVAFPPGRSRLVEKDWGSDTWAPRPLLDRLHHLGCEVPRAHMG